jgi:hypothetical protein
MALLKFSPRVDQAVEHHGRHHASEAQVDDAHQRLPNDSTPEAQEAENVQTEWNVGRNEGLDDRSDPKWQTFAPPLGWFLLRR